MVTEPNHVVIRTFLAVELDEPLRRQLMHVQQDLKTLVEQQSSKDLRISWTKPASIHLTIKFLGDMAESLVDPLRQGIERAIGSCQALSIPLDRLGAFPYLQQPRLLWIGPPSSWAQSKEAQRMTEWHRAIEVCSASFGFVSEGKPLSPHVTVARIKGGERTMGRILATQDLLHRPLALGTLSVESVVLMQSDLRAGGSVYTPLWSCRLAKRAEA